MDSQPAAPANNATDTFEVFYQTGATVYNRVKGNFVISDSSLTLHDSSGNELFNLAKESIASIEDLLRAIMIKCIDKKWYIVHFSDPTVLMKTGLMLGPIFSFSKNNGAFAEGPRQKCKLAIDSLAKHGYAATYSRKRTVPASGSASAGSQVASTDKKHGWPLRYKILIALIIVVAIVVGLAVLGSTQH